LDFEQSICSLDIIEKCVKNQMTFANGIMGKGKGPLPSLAAHTVQVLTIGSFSYCIMEKFLDWQQDIEQSFEAKASTSPKPTLDKDDDPEIDLPYGPGKKKLCSQIAEIIRSTLGKENLTPAYRKKDFFQKVWNGLHDKGTYYFAQ
jgi:hypothetical protein